MHLSARFALVALTCAIIVSGSIQVSEAIDPPPVVNERVVATLVAGEVRLTGEHLLGGGAASISFSAGGVMTPESQGVSAWSDSDITLALSPDVHGGSLVVTADGQASAPVELLVYELSLTSMATPAWGSDVPLSVALDAEGTLWVNEEFHTELKSVSRGETPAMQAVAIPVPEGDGIFGRSEGAGQTWISMLGEDIEIAADGSVWFTQGGAYLYTGSDANASRIVRYQPGTGAFDCYTAPTDSAEVIGVALDDARGMVWYSEASLAHGNAITGFDPDVAPSDCSADPDAGDVSSVCGTEPASGCHHRFVLPGANLSPSHLELDADGNIWFPQYWNSSIARLDPDTGVVDVLPLPEPTIAAGPGIWVGSGPWELAFGSDGALWVSEYFDAAVLRVDPAIMQSADCSALDASGDNPCVREVFAGSDGSDGATVHTLTTAADGRIWFSHSEAGASQLAFIDPANGDALTMLPPLPNVREIAGIAVDPANGDVWFAAYHEHAVGRLRAAWTDGDGIAAAVDNCPATWNPGQLNSDRDLVDLAQYGKIYDDNTWPNHDAMGDACDDDADNDGLTNTAEASAGTICTGASGATSPVLRDSDGDMVLDGAECALGTNPLSPASRPPIVPPGDTDRDGLTDWAEVIIGTLPSAVDTDADGVTDGVEFKFYNSNPNAEDTDGDGCPDRREIASINQDRRVNSMDLSQTYFAYGNAAHPKYVSHFDTNGDRWVNSLDLAFSARNNGLC